MKRQKSFDNDKTTLYLVATPIGNLDEMSVRAVNTLRDVDIIAAEDTRNTIKLLNHFDISTKMIAYHDHNILTATSKIINKLLEGNNVALVSDAGYPAISDPGYELVKAAIDNEINVVVISGPNAAINALVVSGIAPQPFYFYGFLSHSDKTKKKELEKLKTREETFILYESPHRIKKTLNLMNQILGNRNIALCREITKRHEEVLRGTIEEVLEVVDDLKGEMVIVIEGNKVKEEETFDLSIEEHVEEYIAQGLTKKDAIFQVSKIRNINKNEVYNVYHKKNN